MRVSGYLSADEEGVEGEPQPASPAAAGGENTPPLFECNPPYPIFHPQSQIARHYFFFEENPSNTGDYPLLIPY